MLTTRVGGVFGVSGLECEPVAFWLEGQLGGFVVRPVSMPATFTRPRWEKGRAAVPKFLYLRNKIKQSRELFKRTLGFDF